MSPGFLSPWLAQLHSPQWCSTNVWTLSKIVGLGVCLVKVEKVISALGSDGWTNSEGAWLGAVLCSYWMMCYI